jgi:hypothetical protein
MIIAEPPERLLPQGNTKAEQLVEYPIDAQQEPAVHWHAEALALRDIWLTSITDKGISWARKRTSIGHFDRDAPSE